MNLAAFLDSPGGDFQPRPTDVPLPGPSEIVIRVARIALNQIDKRVAMHAAFPEPYPAIIGACIAGRVEALGQADLQAPTSVSTIVASTQSAGATARTTSIPPCFAVGDHVAAYTSFYSRKDHKDNRFGAFQQFVLCNERTVLKLNGSAGLSDAASIIASAPLAGVALSQHIGMTLSVDETDDAIAPSSASEQTLKLLCYGASTSIGGFITQLAAQSGHQVVCTAKSANHEYVRSLGALKVFDYTNTARVIEQLADEGPYDAIVDCISTEQTVRLLNSVVTHVRTHSSFDKAPPIIYTLLPVPSAVPSAQNGKSENMQSSNTAVNDAIRCQTKFIWLTASFGKEDKFDFTRWLFRNVLQSRLDAGKLIATPPLLVNGGLGALREALERMSDVSAEKVVVVLDE